MDLEMVLNELSLRSPADDISTARTWMSDLLSTISLAASFGVKKVIHVDRNLFDVALAPDYPIARWFNDSQIDRDTRLFFKTLATKLSYIPDLPEFWYGEDQARGLGFAFQYEHLALSLRSEKFWYPGRIELEVRYPELDENDQIVTERVEAIHASSSDHVLEHADWIKKRIKTEIHEGSDLWNRREELFANLQFCESVEAQLKDLKFGNWLLHLVERKLFELEDFCEQWQARADAFDVQRIPGKGGSESEATLTEYGQHRTFRCPDGEYRVFSFHIRITRNWRVYYFPIGEKQQIFIGYIGEHLPTKKYS